MKNKILSILLVFILLISTIFSSVYGFSYNDTDINSLSLISITFHTW